MRPLLAALLAFLPLAAPAQQPTTGCTGLCLQQVSCPNGASTTITGTVYAPNGTDPLPGVIVYVPNAPVDAFTPGVSCPSPTANPSGSPLVGAITATDGTFTITNMPAGANIPLVAVIGRWRRQITLPNVAACTSQAAPIKLPSTQAEGDIPLIALSTGDADDVECVLRKVGIADSEFTDPSGSGRIQMYLSTGDPGAHVDPATPSADTLMGSLSTLNQYDVLMLPCEGKDFPKSSGQLANLISFTNAGGRVYTSHFGYEWMWQNPPFDAVVNWDVNQNAPPNGTATVDTTFAQGATLATWLSGVGASTTPGQISLSTLKHDFNGVNSPTQSWLTLNNAAFGNPIMQFTFDTPVNTTGTACGRVLYNEYHVENPTVTPKNYAFPAECSNTAITPQEKLLEYMLFDLTSDAGSLTLSPSSLTFPTTDIGFPSGTETITITNSSIFEETVSSTATGPFQIVSSTCTVLLPNQACTLTLSFTPTSTGANSGTVTITTGGKTVTSSLTGTGTPPLVLTSSLNFGSIDVGATDTRSLTLTNTADGAIPLGTPSFTGPYSLASNACPATLAAGAACTLTLAFHPTSTGDQPGSFTLASSNPTYGSSTASTLDGNATDFALSLSLASATEIAGFQTTPTSLTTTPIAGFTNPVTLSCTTDAPGGICTPAVTSFIPAAATTTPVTIGTTSATPVIGYGSLLLLLPALALRRRRRLLTLLPLLSLFWIAGCGSHTPAANANPTAPGTYAFTLTVTDGFLTHSQTFNLTVTKN